MRDRVVRLLDSVIDNAAVVPFEEVNDDYFMPVPNSAERVNELLNANEALRQIVVVPELPEGFQGVPAGRPTVVHTIVYYILKARVEQFVQQLEQAGGGGPKEKLRYLLLSRAL